MSGIVQGLSPEDVVFTGTHLGFKGTTAVQKGIAGITTEAVAGVAWSSATGAGQTIQSLNVASSLASTSIDTVDFVSGVGLVKIVYDSGSFLAGGGVCLSDVK